MKRLFLAICCSIALLHTAAQTRVQLEAPPEAGHSVKMTYAPAGALLAGEQQLKAVLAWFDKDRQLSEETVMLQRDGQQWSAAITVPERAVLLQVTPAAGKETDDNNGKGYMFPVYANGKPLPFAYYRMSVLVSGASSLKKDPAGELMYLKKEIAVNPVAEPQLRGVYFNMLANSPEPEDKALLLHKLLAWKTDNEAELTLNQRYFLFLGEKHAADSLATLLRHRFPTGIFVREEYILAVNQEKDFGRKTALFNQFIKQFPEPAAKGKPDYQYTRLYQEMGTAAIESGNETAAEKYIAQLQQRNDKVAFFARTARYYLSQQQLQAAVKWAERGVQITDTSSVYGWDAYLALASARLEQQQYDKGLPLAATAYAHTKNKEAAILYVKLLVAAGKPAVAQALIENAVQHGEASVEMKAQLKELYEKTGNILPYQQYLAGLMPPAGNKEKQSLKESMLKESVGDISLLDTGGQTVQLSDFKGKIIVLDFWATWCKPCIQSFPAMQQVMQQHPEVVFLFIATFETGDALQKVKQFSHEKQFPFRYLIDEPLKGETNFKAFTHFRVPSVPYKVVLDKKGNIRFRSGGFAGNDDALITELNTMIGLLEE
ncbi:TlpA disulfide reductase family protein [Chitinophaga sp. OAE865]|uniref:redoxin domain-containing protein n=1 Tax=Chitinophaga sp. OAE865 TaxID=2817898 RepID=UPI001AE7D149